MVYNRPPRSSIISQDYFEQERHHGALICVLKLRLILLCRHNDWRRNRQRSDCMAKIFNVMSSQQVTPHYWIIPDRT